MVELVDAPDSKSGGLRPLGVRVPLPALGFDPELTCHMEGLLTRPDRSEPSSGVLPAPRLPARRLTHRAPYPPRALPATRSTSQAFVHVGHSPALHRRPRIP